MFVYKNGVYINEIVRRYRHSPVWARVRTQSRPGVQQVFGNSGNNCSRSYLTPPQRRFRDSLLTHAGILTLVLSKEVLVQRQCWKQF